MQFQDFHYLIAIVITDIIFIDAHFCIHYFIFILYLNTVFQNSIYKQVFIKCNFELVPNIRNLRNLCCLCGNHGDVDIQLWGRHNHLPAGNGFIALFGINYLPQAFWDIPGIIAIIVCNQWILLIILFGIPYLHIPHIILII